MTIAQRHTAFFRMADKDMAATATLVLNQLAEKLQQSCHLAVRQENGFRVVFQSAPSTSFYVNMPVGLVYQAPATVDGVAQAGQQPNPSLPDVIDFYAPVFQAGEQVALLIAPYIKRRGAPPLEQCRDAMMAAAKHLSASAITHALVA
ncbi:hypothetical protein [Asticcacaulis sp. 201]|uniref:hypothetical protein n=1 Tax=Asticcacaulis sp. 201 TaxID=3028787 RepID=UPI002916E0CC|nr:hypothetical protein [Asticcacaulis sp. 201]MDV6330888.1 hypothetical protein [Asticcacaulis sp. 201]